MLIKYGIIPQVDFKAQTPEVLLKADNSDLVIYRDALTYSIYAQSFWAF